MLFTGVGHVQCVAAAVRAVAHPALAALAPVRTLDRWGFPPIPLNTGRGLPSIRSSTGGGAHCYRCVWCHGVSSFLGAWGWLGVKNTRDLHPIRRYRRLRGLLWG